MLIFDSVYCLTLRYSTKRRIGELHQYGLHERISSGLLFDFLPIGLLWDCFRNYALSEGSHEFRWNWCLFWNSKHEGILRSCLLNVFHLLSFFDVLVPECGLPCPYLYLPRQSALDISGEGTRSNWDPCCRETFAKQRFSRATTWCEFKFRSKSLRQWHTRHYINVDTDVCTWAMCQYAHAHTTSRTNRIIYSRELAKF